MENLISILMKRDGLDREEARDLVREARMAVHEALEFGYDPEEAFTDATGLEPDYIMDIL